MQENTNITHYLYDTDCIKEEDMDISEGTSQPEVDNNHPEEEMSLTENNSQKGKERSQKETDTGHWDRGWAWMVAIGASICNVILFGCFAKSSGIMLNEVVERFQNPTAYSISIFICMGFTMLCSKYHFLFVLESWLF